MSELTGRQSAELAGRIERVLESIVHLRGLFETHGPGKGGGDLLEATRELHHSLLHAHLNRLDDVEEIVLRPLAEKATLLDAPDGKTREAGHGKTGARDDAWGTAFPGFRITPRNVIANEQYVTVEYELHARQARPLVLPGGRRYGVPAKPLQVAGAYVVRIDEGAIAQIDHYYDLSGILRYLGLIADAPMGHDEAAGRSQVLMHAAGGFAGGGIGPLLRPRDLKAGERAVSVGLSASSAARTNLENCAAIHAAFVDHTPERFAQLIADDAVWIDMPTGIALNGAIAAAHHDHGNWQTAFPDSTAVIDALIANQEWVTVQHRGSGTHTGPLVLGGKTYDGTGRKMEIRVLDIVQYRAGKAVLIRNYYDLAMMASQLGIALG